MCKHFKAAHLSQELKDLLREMLDEGCTYDEMADEIRSRGGDVSRMGIYRYVKRQEGVMRNLRTSRMAADAIVGRLGVGADEGALGRALTQMVQTLAFEYVSKRAENKDEQIPLDEIYKLALTVRAATLAGRAGQDHQVKTRRFVREEEKAEAEKEAAAEAALPVSYELSFGGEL